MLWAWMKSLGELERRGHANWLAASVVFAIGLLVGRALNPSSAPDDSSMLDIEFERAPSPLVCDACRGTNRERDLPASTQRVAIAGPPVPTLNLEEFLASTDSLAPAIASHSAVNLLRQDRSLEAYGLLSTTNADSSAPYLATAQALARQGHSARASEMFEAALERESWWDDDMLHLFVKHDARACLEALDREVARQLAAGVSDPLYELSDQRAQALQALGRSAEAVQLLDNPEEMYVPSSGGCTPSHFRGSSWKWAAWAEVDPRRVEAILEQAERDGAPNLLFLKGQLLLSEGRHEELDAELEQVRKKSGTSRDYGHLLIALAPERGWDTVREYLQEQPSDDRAVRAYSDHLLKSGRIQDATELLHQHVLDTWEQGLSDAEIAETIQRLPKQLMPSLEVLVQKATNRDQASDDFAYELATLGDAFWRLGKSERAKELWRKALALDPDCGWLGYLRQAELGVDPFGDG